MNKAVWTVGFGVVLGFLLFLLYDVMKDDGGGGRLFDLKADTLSVNKGNVDSESINKRLSSLEDSVSFMSQTLEDLSIQLSASNQPVDGDGSSLPTRPEVGNREPIPAKTAKTDEPVEGKKNWMDFVDRSIAKALVEYGLTPYERDVPPLMRNAADGLREVHERYKKRFAEHISKWDAVKVENSKDPAIKQRRAEYEALERWKLNEREPILDSFRAALAELEKKR